MKKNKEKIKKGWTISDVYDIKWTDGGTFYMQPTYTCKYCGYTFEGLNECGTWGVDEDSPSEKNDAEAVDHIMKYHQ